MVQVDRAGVGPREPASRTVLFALLALAVLFPLAPAHAADSTPRTRPGRYQLGPLYLTPKLELKSAGVDTNVFNRQTGAIPDTQIVLSPGVQAALPIGRRLRFTGQGFLDLNYFKRQGSERSTDRAADGRAELDFGPFTFSGAGGGGQYKQRFSIDVDDRLLRQERWAQVGARLKLSRRISVTGIGTSRVYRFESSLLRGVDVREALDRNTLSATVEGRVALTNLTTLLLSAEGIEDRFLSAGLSATPSLILAVPTSDPLGAKDLTPSRRVQSFRYLGGFEFGQRAFINGKVLAGYRGFPGTGGQAAPAYRGPALSIGATLPLMRLGRLAISADRDVNFAATSTAVGENRLRNTYVSSRYAGQFSFELPFDLTGRASAGYEQLRYVFPDRAAAGYVRRADNQYLFGGSLLRRFGDSLRIGGTVAWVRRVSTIETGSYQGLRYGVQAEVIP